ncbi:MAG TPA: JAB domain-containing protein [Kouleothrix sp.]|nr:JAB domain-containing protein [Kouleothrix sp.]
MARTLKPVYDYVTPSCADAPAQLFMAPIIRMQIVRESQAAAAVQIRSPQQAWADCLRGRFANCDREVMVSIILNTKNRVLAIDPVFQGNLNASIVTMRELFKSALLLGAAAIIAAHNHPSGDATPSPEDVLITREMIAAGRLLDIELLDHLVLGAESFVSMRERGLGFSR